MGSHGHDHTVPSLVVVPQGHVHVQGLLQQALLTAAQFPPPVPQPEVQTPKVTVTGSGDQDANIFFEGPTLLTDAPLPLLPQEMLAWHPPPRCPPSTPQPSPVATGVGQPPSLRAQLRLL